MIKYISDHESFNTIKNDIEGFNIEKVIESIVEQFGNHGTDIDSIEFSLTPQKPLNYDRLGKCVLKLQFADDICKIEIKVNFIFATEQI